MSLKSFVVVIQDPYEGDETRATVGPFSTRRAGQLWIERMDPHLHPSATAEVVELAEPDGELPASVLTEEAQNNGSWGHEYGCQCGCAKEALPPESER